MDKKHPKLYKMTLKPSGEVIEVAEGKSILATLKEKNIFLKSTCGGHSTCADCVVKIVSGEDYLTPPPFVELKMLGNVFHLTKERLACQTCLIGDVTVDISKHDKITAEVKVKKKIFRGTKVRKETEVKTLRSERVAEQALEAAEHEKKTKNWEKHWEKNPDTDSPKKLAGGKRPKFFDTDKVDYEKNDYTRPLSAEKQKLRDERLALEKLKANNKDKITASDKEYKKFRE